MSAIGPSPDARTNFIRKVILTICLFLAVCISLGASLYRWHNGVDVQNQNVRAMFVIVNHYVKTNDGAWPQSWDDLQSLPQAELWHTRLDYEIVKKSVVIDFEASPAELAKQSAAEFHAVDAVNPVFDFAKDPRITILLNTLKKYHATQ